VSRPYVTESVYRHLIVARSAAGSTVIDRAFNADDEIANASEQCNDAAFA
jgi:hypothetical protein